MFDPIFVLTYKNRPENIIQRLLDGRLSIDPKRKIYFVCYDFDFVESGYDKYELPENMSFLKIDFQNDFVKNGFERCLQAKRYFICNKAREMGYHYCWQFDDDLLSVWKAIFREDKCNEKVEAPLEEALQFMEDRMKNKVFSVAGFPYNKGSMEFTWLKKIYDKEDSFVIDNMYINLDECKKVGLNYTPLKNHAEDLMMCVDSYRKGLHTYVVEGSYCLHFDPPGKSGSLADKYKEISYNVWKEYGRLFRYKDNNRSSGKDKEKYVSVQLDRKRLAANITKIADEAQIEMEKATNADEWTKIVSDLTKKYNLGRKGL